MEIINGIDPISYVIHPHQSMIVPYNVFCIANAILNCSHDEYLAAFIGNKWNDAIPITGADYAARKVLLTLALAGISSA